MAFDRFARLFGLSRKKVKKLFLAIQETRTRRLSRPVVFLALKRITRWIDCSARGQRLAWLPVRSAREEQQTRDAEGRLVRSQKFVNKHVLEERISNDKTIFDFLKTCTG